LSTPNSTRSLEPQLLSRLAAVRGRIRRLSLLRGLGLWLAVTALVFIGSFYLDRLLNPPHAMRLLVGPLVGVSLAVAFWWWIVRPLRVRLTDDDAALAVERVYPELGDRLVSALQLSRSSGNASPDLVERAIAAGEDATRSLDFNKAARTAPSAWRMLAGLSMCAVLLGIAISDPQDFKVFLTRFFGAKVEWPQRTHLEIEIPVLSSTVKVQREGDEIRVRIARGADMAVRVKAVGDVPPLVELVDSHEKRTPMALSPPNEYQARYHAVRENFEFHAEGGDDRDGLPKVVVQTVVPPSIRKIHVSVAPPSYSGIPGYEREGGSFEALMGSKARVFVETSSPVKRGALRFRDSEEEIALAPAAGTPTGDVIGGPGVELAAEILIERNRRYTLEVEDPEGLRNPDAGSYSIVALTDRAPEVKLLAPSRAELDVTLDGVLAIHGKVTDDFGVQEARLRWKTASAADLRTLAVPVLAADGQPKTTESAPAQPTAPKSGLLRSRLDVAALRLADPKEGGAERAPKEGDVLELYLEALDGRAPSPGVGESPHVRAVVLAGGEILKRITERLSRTKDTVQSILNTQIERKRRVVELIEALSGSDNAPAADRPTITNVMVGQGRISTDARAMAREFFESTESIAGNKLDRTGEAVFAELERLRATMPSAADDPYHFELALALVTAVRSGTLGSPLILGKFADMLQEAAKLAGEHSPGVVKALDAAALATRGKDAVTSLETAVQKQDAAIQSLERLLALLSEWDNFQSVITATREIYDQQRSLNLRTKEEAKAK